MTDLSAVLAERGKTHGNFTDHATITQRLKAEIRSLLGARGYPGSVGSSSAGFTYEQVEALEMIAHKMGRILAGDPNFKDHWDDIAGYAKLVSDRCTK